MNKILTLIIPTYNMEDYLDKCLASLLVTNTALNSLEVLVVNDGSKDSSSAIGRCYEKMYPQTFRVIDKENGNYGSCVNRGLKEATGKYIKVLDADDTFDTINFDEFLQYLQKTDVDCILTDMVQVDANGNRLRLCNFKMQAGIPLSLNELSDENLYNLWMHNVCYKTENLRRINYVQTEGISYTDQEWIFLPMSTCKEIVYWPHIVYCYLVGRVGQTIDEHVWEKNFWMEIKGLCIMLDEHENSSSSKLDTKYLDRRLAFRTKTVYWAYFSRFNTTLNNDALMKLDILLFQRNYHLWVAASDYTFPKFFPFKVVRLWRKHYDSDRLSIIILRWIGRSISNAGLCVKKLLEKVS